ncbi:MAG: hypothetical protein R3338_12180, partial [Thermoanaerobaculia bacterium]|nr:hypothetical protein [Thermoanaerobaculia bacterium]
FAETDSSGIFSLLLPSGSYRLVATDPSFRYAKIWYDDAPTFEEAKTILLGAGIVRPVEFALDRQELSRRRSVRRR